MPRHLRLLALLAGALIAVAAPAPAGAQAPPGPEDAGAAIARVAQAELRRGVAEAPRGSNAGAGVARYHAATVGARPGQPWCAYFASWVSRAAGHPVGPAGRGLASSGQTARWARRTGRWGHRPVVGSVFVLPAHVGVVVAVRGSRIVTVEGNWSDRVSRMVRPASSVLGNVAPPPRDWPLAAGFAATATPAGSAGAGG